jgi:hypothetical protein
LGVIGAPPVAVDLWAVRSSLLRPGPERATGAPGVGHVIRKLKRAKAPGFFGAVNDGDGMTSLEGESSMADPNGLRAVDVLSVRSRVSWGAISAGAMVALAVYFVLTLLGVAIGLEGAVRGQPNLGFGAALYSIITLLLAMFLGGWSVSRLAVGESKLEAILYGVILWGVLFLGMFWLVSVGVRVGFGAILGLTYGAAPMAPGGGQDAGSSSSGGLVNSVVSRYDASFGGGKFEQDLKSMGVDEEKAKSIQAMVNDRLAGIRTGAAPLADQVRDAVNDPAVRENALAAVDQTRRATWYTLLGVLVSMVTVIVGSLIGSGDLPSPVPILGVRKPVRPT